MMNIDWFFFEQTKFRPTPKRTRKLPEDLPVDLRQSHPNPKVANYLANKQRSQNEESFGGKKSLLPEINQAFQTVKSRLDSSLSNDEDSQRFLFDQSKASAANILHQLAKILYLYDNVVDFVPKSLEYQIMCGYKELTADIIFVPREWQTPAMKEKLSKQPVPIILSDDEHDAFSDNEDAKSRQSVDRHSEGGKKKKSPQSVKSGLPGISEDEEKSELKPPQMKRGLSKLSMSSKSMTPNRSKGDKGKLAQVEISSRHSGKIFYGPYVVP